MQEMVSLANEMAQRIAYDTRDWTMLRNGGAFTGDGVKLSFPLSANYKRLLLTTNVRREDNPSHPLRFVADLDAWQRRRLENATDSYGEWLINAGEMHIWPVLPLNVRVLFTYLDKNCINLSSGGRGDTFMNDLDSFALDERLLKLAMIYQWKAQKGSSYAEDMSTYGDALMIAMGHDQPAPIYIDRKPISASISGTYGGPVP